MKVPYDYLMEICLAGDDHSDVVKDDAGDPDLNVAPCRITFMYRGKLLEHFYLYDDDAFDPVTWDEMEEHEEFECAEVTGDEAKTLGERLEELGLLGAYDAVIETHKGVTVIII